MSGDFLDSNVILYAFDVDQRKQEIARRLVNDALVGDALISFQVVQEVLNILTRKAQALPTGDEPRRVLEDVLMPLWHVMPSEDLYARALALQSRYQFAFYDSLIIAAALQAGCTRLLSEDLQTGQRIERLTIVDPFASAWGGRR
jgi:predicted nucleic acid-binding protein